MEDGARAVGDGEFVVPGRDAAPLLHQREGALDYVSVLVRFGVEPWWPAAGAALALAGGDLVALLRDDRGDPAGSEHPAVHPTGVGLVRGNRVRAGAGPPGTDPWHPDVVEDLFEHRAVVALPAGDHDSQWQAVPVDGVMDLRGQTATGAADAMTSGFNVVGGQILVV